MKLTEAEQAMLQGRHGPAAQKAMRILEALGTIYGAQSSVAVTSVQVAGVSFDNLGEAGLQFLSEMAEGGARARVLTTLNPAGMDIENPGSLGIDPLFAANQRRVIAAFARMGIQTTCTCTPYLVGNRPACGEHIAWAESSAVCYANSVLGARTNREGGPSALAAAITGRTPHYGLHLDENRRPNLSVIVRARLQGTVDFGALGQIIGKTLEGAGGKRLAYLIFETPPENLETEGLKSLCASLATYGGAGLFHIEGVTPEAGLYRPPQECLVVEPAHLAGARQELSDATPDEVDFISLGCPHLTLAEIGAIAARLEGRRVQRQFWITAARPVKRQADALGYSAIIEASGAKFATDTCCVVAPIRGRFHALATDSAKACYYAAAKNRFKTLFLSFADVIELALQPRAEVGA